MQLKLWRSLVRSHQQTKTSVEGCLRKVKTVKGLEAATLETVVVGDGQKENCEIK